MRVLLLLLLLATPALAESVMIVAGEVTLRAEYERPSGPQRTAIVALHGCGGPYPARERFWRDKLVPAGHAMVLPDSFTSRALGSQCREPSRTISPGTGRRQDAYAAAAWIAAQPGTPPGGIVLFGWSNGGSTAIAAANDPPPGLIRGIIAFYPGCRAWAERANWRPAAPMLILMGADDDWTPPEPCQRLAARYPDMIRLVLYSGAYHDFDAPNLPVTTRTGLANTANGVGTAHIGTNQAAQADAQRQVIAFLAQLPPLASAPK